MNISEKDVTVYWQEQIRHKRRWLDSEGNRVEILYPGRFNDGRGGDFKDALISYNKEKNFGCIEVHTRSSGWQEHGHNQDPAYNQVILHVVWEANSSRPILRQNGQRIPTITLKEVVSSKKVKSTFSCLGVGRRKKLKSIQRVLAKAGDIRFKLLAEKHRRLALPSEAGQSLFQGLMESLGYSKNKVPFRDLASFIPLDYLEKTVFASRFEEDSLIQMQAILLGKAGLLPSQRLLDQVKDEYIEELERAWANSSQSASLSVRNWELFRVRPDNYPVLRMAALSQLLYSWREKGCLETLLDLVRTVPLKRSDLYLEAKFLVKAQSYWKNHFDFGRACKNQKAFILGKARAAEIIVNILLPFTFTWGLTSLDPLLCDKASEIYRRYPRLGSNSIERHMLNQLSLVPGQVNSARFQQGLIHIYKTWCTQGRCLNCYFSK